MRFINNISHSSLSVLRQMAYTAAYDNLNRSVSSLCGLLSAAEEVKALHRFANNAQRLYNFQLVIWKGMSSLDPTITLEVDEEFIMLMGWVLNHKSVQPGSGREGARFQYDAVHEELLEHHKNATYAPPVGAYVTGPRVEQ